MNFVLYTNIALTGSTKLVLFLSVNIAWFVPDPRPVIAVESHRKRSRSGGKKRTASSRGQQSPRGQQSNAAEDKVVTTL